ncbi:lytic transglycosylase [Pseudomonas alcaligenes]|uniref:Lytic transglycosylase n=1 Tax=Aquipseudomonas alcaligenes TaxID=43263 RepID=A0ABR7RZ80_AQUAC|nr:transglycosylase SLT domain-containing protein [Pseudomonas alcaligenes]MBC9249855.1 lytic transglycosylase [Pseudomonas alcaligenes]
MSIVSLTPAINAARTQQAQGGDPREQLQAASEQFEALFLQQILKQMRKAGDVLSAGNPMRSRELDTMRDFYDEALAEHLATSKQTGIANLLVKQLSTAGADPEQLAAATEAARSAPLARSSISARQPLASTWQRSVEVVSQAWQRGSEALGQLVDSLIQHESSGDIAAVSAKGARGLMQLMPDTAREMAAKLGLEFDEQRLTRDGAYNKQLGVAYLNEMLERYDGHQALAVAAYNAGPGKVDEWLQSNGDPRSGQIGTEAWVQRIPYEETRNYTRSILQDLRRDAAVGTPAPAVQPLRLPAGIEAREERLRAGELLGLAASRRPDLGEPTARAGEQGFKPQADSVAYLQRTADSAPTLQHQSRSAAFAQPIRIEPKGSLS